MTYARKSWQEERLCWRPVVQLNLVRSIILLLDLLSTEISSSDQHRGAAYISPVPSDESEEDEDGQIRMLNSYDDADAAAGAGAKNDRRQPVDKGKRVEYSFKFSEKHRFMHVRLGPLRSVQRDLMKLLGAGSEEPVPSGPTYPAPFEYPASSYATPSPSPRMDRSPSTSPRHPQEFFVRSSVGWRSALGKIGPVSPKQSHSSYSNPLAKSVDDTTGIIAGCRDNMRSLWEDPVIKAILRKHGRKLEDEAGLRVSVV